MQQRTIISRGKRYLVNVATDDGIGSGFPMGQILMKSITDSFWYIITASGSYGDVSASVSQITASFPTSSYFDINYPYQLLGANNGNTYAVYLSGSAPNAALVVSQSAYTGSCQPKPNLLIQNINDGNFYTAYVSSSGTTIFLTVNQSAISASWLQNY